ncbi:hypothetical protein CPB83DRAFT_246002 [Crepidotus variabilis]|uniref:Uncharacterized protein n=1 Tax=Crepidotus variabilis TaxID=179855 RepID=A0A9P6E2Y7_9AGAR|nr:hypothetical protein CPB83DRAFT_246002 [Crepidotus variabilis]
MDPSLLHIPALPFPPTPPQPTLLSRNLADTILKYCIVFSKKFGVSWALVGTYDKGEGGEGSGGGESEIQGRGEVGWEKRWEKRWERRSCRRQTMHTHHRSINSVLLHRGLLNKTMLLVVMMLPQSLNTTP